MKDIPWLEKAQQELTRGECARAARHDSFYWWSKGKCHAKDIRYAFGVAVRDTSYEMTDESGHVPEYAKVRKGELVTGITQFRSKEGTYCIPGGSCIPASDIKLIGSVILPTYGNQLNSAEDLGFSGVATSCELSQ